MIEIDLAGALENEHHEIDGHIEAFVAAPEKYRGELLAAMADLRRHIYLEEEFLFPKLRTLGLVMPVLVMLREHGEIWRNLDTLETELANPSLELAVRTCMELLDQLNSHNLKEEPVLYPQIATALGEAGVVRFWEIFERNQMPAGWICANATS